MSLCLCVPFILFQYLILFQDGVEEGGEGDEDGGAGEPEVGGLADRGVAGLDFVGLDVDDVVLLEIIVGRADDVGIVEVEGVDLLPTLRIFTDELDFVAYAVDGEVACLGEGFEDVDLLVAHDEHARIVDFAKDGDLVVGHADCDHGILVDIEIGHDLVVYQFFAHGLGEAAHFEGAEDRELDAAFVVDEVGLEGSSAGGDVGCGVLEGRAHDEVEGRCCLGVDGVDGDGEDVLGHDAGVVEHLRTGGVDVVGVLEVCDVFNGAAGCQERTGQEKNEVILFHISNLLIEYDFLL